MIVHPESGQRVALVTGGSTGIGRAIASALSKDGLTCVVVARRAQPLADTVANGDAYGAIQADLISDSAASSVYSECVERYGRPLVVINNAGGTDRRVLGDHSERHWHGVMRLNIEAAFQLIRCATPAMVDSGWGRIVNIASVYGMLGLDHRLYMDDPATAAIDVPRAFSYTAAKGGILALTRELACALGGHNITVNAVSPGMIDVSERPLTGQHAERLAGRTPVRRVGKPADVAHAVSFLVSDASSFITGHNLVVDGGWSAW